MTPYGVVLVLACLVAWLLARRRAAAVSFDPSHIDLALPLAFIAGAFAAGVLGWLAPAEYRLAGDAYLADERRRLYAVALVGLPVLYVYARVAGLSLRRLADVLAVPALVFMAVVRIGCFLAGCCFGDLSGHLERLAAVGDPAVRQQLATVGWLSAGEAPWAVRFPAGSFAHRQHELLGLLEPGAKASLPVHPVQLYETAALLILCVVVIWLRPRLARCGDEALLVLASYAGLQFLLEFLRADNALVAGPLNLNQFICLAWLLFATALAAVIYRYRTH
jgi:phosphatidylglycerol---prolipoprotein diacylglyceryl transferase